LKTGKDIDQGRLARTIRADQADDLAAPNSKTGVVYRPQALKVDRDIAHRKGWRGQPSGHCTVCGHSKSHSPEMAILLLRHFLGSDDTDDIALFAVLDLH